MKLELRLIDEYVTFCKGVRNVCFVNLHHYDNNAKNRIFSRSYGLYR